MSKLSTWKPEEVKAMRPDVDYNIVDLTVLDRETSADLMKHMSEYLAGGHLKAIPYVKFDALSIRQALQYFQKAKHIGKVVVSMPTVVISLGHFKTEVPIFNGESTYMITGGLGGIGFEVCKWMIDLGATDFVLIARSPPKPEVAKAIKQLNENGHNLMVRLCDVGDYNLCKAMVEEINATMKPLRGVMHCAGVLRDNLYVNQTWNDFEATYNPKIKGTWNLHQLTQTCPLEYFVVYSSLTALVGTPGQPNHCSANCYEDALVHLRHSMGLPGTTINWRQWSQVGCAKEISLSGVLPVSMKRMLNGLEVALRAQKRQVCFSEFDSFTNFSMLCPAFRQYLDDRVWKQYNNQAQGSQEAIKAEQLWLEMDGVETKAEKIEILLAYLKAIIRKALRLEPDDPISEDANIQELGVDSLMMIELRNCIQTLLGSRLVVTSSILKNCNTTRLLANAIVGKLMEGEEDEELNLPLEPLDSADLLELLTKDAQLPVEVRVAPESEYIDKTSKIKSILVTGATGQLGPYVLQEICKEYRTVEKIYCLIRGSENDVKATEKLHAHLKALRLEEKNAWDKVECVTGNVAMDNLGINPKTYAELSKSIDGIVHLAAKTHASEHLRPSRKDGKGTDCRSVNILGTLNILKFACAGPKVKRVFYASTLVCGIFGQSEKDVLPDNWPETGVIRTILDNKIPGLQSSKWICEMLMEQANQRGIPCKVFRFPWIAGDSKTGQVSVLSNTYVIRFLGFLKMGAMPDLVVPAVVLPADICAQVALKLFMNESTPNEIFNVAHPQPEVEQEFVRVAMQEFGKRVEILEWKAFLDRLTQQQMETGATHDLFQDMKIVSKYFSDAVSFVSRYTQAPDTYFANEKVSRFIPNYGSEFPSTMYVVAKNLKYAQEKGIMNKFGI